MKSSQLACQLNQLERSTGITEVRVQIPANLNFFHPFLTRGDARAYHELLQGLGYANQSLAHSQQTDIGSRLIRMLECKDLSFPKKHTFPEVRCDRILMRTCIVRCSYSEFSLWQINSFTILHSLAFFNDNNLGLHFDLDLKIYMYVHIASIQSLLSVFLVTP